MLQIGTLSADESYYCIPSCMNGGVGRHNRSTCSGRFTLSTYREKFTTTSNQIHQLRTHTEPLKRIAILQYGYFNILEKLHSNGEALPQNHF